MKVLRLRQVLEITGLSKSTLYLYIQNREFPTQVQLGPKRVGWIEEEVQGWIKRKIQFRDTSAKLA